MKALISTILFIISFTVFSCDVCEVFDYGANESKSNFRLIYGYRYLSGFEAGQAGIFPSTLKHQPLNPSLIFNDTDDDFELYQRYELRYSHLFKENWLLYLNLPLQKSSVRYGEVYEANLPVFDTTAQMIGLGDFSLGLMRVNTTKTLRRLDNFRYGLQIHTPSGSYNTRSSYFSPRDYAGRGVWSYQLKVSHSSTFVGKWGIQSSGYFQSFAEGPPTAANGFTYNFGKRGYLDVSTFYVFGKTQKLIVMAGSSLYIEGRDEINGEKSDDTGSIISYIKTGVEWRSNRVGIRSILLLPLTQKLQGAQFRTQSQVQLGLQYFIPSKSEEVCMTD